MKSDHPYSVTVIRDFIAQHFLIGGDWGAENSPHSHHYRLEFTVRGDTLDGHNYLVDIVDLEKALDGFVYTYRDRVLNDTPAFAGTNPSLELFCRVAFDEIVAALDGSNILEATVTMWEHDTARASYTGPV